MNSLDILSRSIIRRGNHFICMDGFGWVLIDGPWFRYLSGWPCPYVRLDCFADPFDPSAIEIDDVPKKATFLALDWERVRWFPGSELPLSKWKTCWNWWEYLSGRYKFGWRTLPDGRLPAYLNRLDFGKNPLHDEEIRSLEAILTKPAEVRMGTGGLISTWPTSTKTTSPTS